MIEDISKLVESGVGSTFIVIGLLLFLIGIFGLEGEIGQIKYRVLKKNQKAYVLVAGIIFLLIGFFIFAIKEILELEKWQKDFLTVVDGVILLLFISLVVAIIGLLSYILARWYFLHKFLTWLKRDRRIFSNLLARKKLEFESLKTNVDSTIEDLKEQQEILNGANKQTIDDLKQREIKLIEKVEDATRSVIFGFPGIFHKSLELIQNAEEELWIVNFMIEFGKPHLVNQRIVNDYQRQYKNNFEEDVAIYHDTLKNKLENIPKVRILTVTDEGVTKNFLEPLKEARSDEYAQPEHELKIYEIKKSFMKNKAEISNIMQSRHNQNEEKWGNKDHSAKFCESEKLPLQMILADRGGGKVGCLVFLVGTEVLRGVIDRKELESDFIEAGVYTELPDMIRIYRFLIASLINDADIKHPIYL